MLGSREAAVDYMTPLGLHHQMAAGHHYGPGPWVSGGPRADWTSVYYHRADTSGIGFDRTATGSNAVAQYFPPVARPLRAASRPCPSEYLLWFHHVPLGPPHALGPDAVGGAGAPLSRRGGGGPPHAGHVGALSGRVDAERYEQVRAFLAIQEKEARWWRDACVLYFQTFSGMPLPEGYEKPAHDLEYYEKLTNRYAPGI